MEKKKPWLSKTILLNAVMAVVAFFPVAQAWVSANPQVFVFGFAAVNFVLRLVTKDKISLQE